MNLPEIALEVFDWSELWSLLFPLGVMAFTKPDNRLLKPVTAYLLSGFIFYFLIDFSWKFKKTFSLPDILNDNNFLYNILSILRTLFFTWFFFSLDLPFLKRTKKIIPILYALFLSGIFLTGYKSFMVFSNFLHVAESIVILVFCFSYFLYILRSELTDFSRQPAFWIVSGLTIFEALSFFVFLFYQTDEGNKMKEFFIDLWYVHNIAHILLCIFLAKAIYESAKQRY